MIHGVESIVTSSMVDLQDSIKLNARIIGTENAEVLYMNSGDTIPNYSFAPKFSIMSPELKQCILELIN